MHTLGAQRFSARLDARLPVVIDGSVRGALLRAGADLEGPLGTAAVLSAECHVLSSIHQRFCAAGVHVVRANTAETTPRALSRSGYGYRSAKLSSLAIDTALSAVQASGRSIGVAGVQPPMDASDARLRGEQMAHAQRLMAAGADLIFVGPVRTLREAVAATAAAVQTQLPVVVELDVDDDGNLPDGEGLDVVCGALAGAGALGFLARPNGPSGEMRATVELSTLGRPWGVLYAGGREMTPTEYAERALGLAEEGATLFGGDDICTPEHLRALVGLLPGAERELRTSLLPGAGGVNSLSNLPPRM